VAGANNNAMPGEALSAPTSATRADIAADLARLGLGRGDAVFFHSSLKSLGWVEGGAEAVLEAFLDTVGPDGLVAVPTLTAGGVPKRASDAFHRGRRPACGGAGARA
jgi:aminoglycoside 3-N-acetyltransferase